MLKSRDYLSYIAEQCFADNIQLKRDRGLVAPHLHQALAVERSRAAADALSRALARLGSAKMKNAGVEQSGGRMDARQAMNDAVEAQDFDRAIDHLELLVGARPLTIGESVKKGRWILLSEGGRAALALT